MTVAFRWARKRETLPRCYHYQVSSAFELDGVATLIFPFGKFLANPPLARPRCCFAHSPGKLFSHLRRQPPEAAWKKIERRAPACIADHASVRGDARVPPLDACSDVSLHHRWSLSSFSFSCTHPSPASSWTALRQWGEHHVSFAPSEFSLSGSVSDYVFHFCNLALLEEGCANLVVESQDEILFKGVGCDALGFQPGLITLMNRSTVLTLVKRRSTWAITSKTSSTTPNDTPWSTHGQGLVKTLVKPLKNTLWPTSVARNFCRVLQISPKYFKFSQCKRCVFCRGTQLSCW
jgi:hypothetical protein